MKILIGLLQFSGTDPNVSIRGDIFACFIQHLDALTMEALIDKKRPLPHHHAHLPGVVVVLEACQRQPELHGERTALHGSSQHDLGVLHPLQLHGGLPQAHGGGDRLQGLAEDAPLGGRVRLEVLGLHPELDRLGDVLESLGHHRLGLLGRLM